MRVEIRILDVLLGAVAGGCLAYIGIAAICIAGNQHGLSATRVSSPRKDGDSIVESIPRLSHPGELPKVEREHFGPDPKNMEQHAESTRLRNFKHVLTRETAYMNLPADLSKLPARKDWAPIGKLPARELVRYEQSLWDSMSILEREDGSHVLIQEGQLPLAECWKLPVSSDVRNLVRSRNLFAWKLYHELGHEGDNLFFSPSSIAEALSMVLVGARGETANEITAALQLKNGPKDAHASGAELRGLLVQPDRHRGFELLVANRAWAQDGYAIEEPFTQILRKDYGTDLGLANFTEDKEREAARKEINDWIARQTKERLKNVVGPRDLNSLTRLVLVNAVYFFGEWDEPFKKEATKEAPFFLTAGKTKPVQMMHRTAYLPYFRGPGFQMASIPYGKGQLSMVLLVPDEVEGLPALERQLEGSAVDARLAQMKPELVDLGLPRLEMRSSLNLVPPLEQLGMKRAFDISTADFSGIHVPRAPVPEELLYISAAIHQSFVKINEEGTEAAAVTVFVGAAGGIPPPPPKVHADRPFLFLIRDELTGTILFVGRVCDPPQD